jgi:outer membrane protein TolC
MKIGKKESVLIGANRWITPESLPDLIAEARAQRPELKSLECRVKAAGDAVRVARAGWYPQVALTGNYYYSRPNQRYFPTKDELKSSWDVGVGAAWDVWNWGTAAHQTTEAKAQLSQLQAALAQLQDAIALEVTQDYLNLKRAEEKALLVGKAIAQADENLRVVTAGFKAGAVLSSELLDAEVSLLQAQLNRTQALVDLELAQAKLNKTLGNEYDGAADGP